MTFVASCIPEKHQKWGLAAVSVGQDPCWSKLGKEFVLCLSISTSDNRENMHQHKVYVQTRNSESSPSKSPRAPDEHLFFSRKALLDSGAGFILDSFQVHRSFTFCNEMLHSDVRLFLLRAAVSSPHRIELGFRAMVIISQVAHLINEMRSSSVVAKIVALIKANPFAKHEPRRLADLYMIEPARLEKMFLEQQRVRLRAFIRNARHDAARLLVVRSQIPLAHIAFDAGFSSQAHMTTVFKCKYGRTPGELRHSAGDWALSDRH